MDSTELRKIADRTRALALKVRGERIAVRRYSAALDRPEVAKLLTPGARQAATIERRSKARDTLKDEVAGLLDVYRVVDEMRAEYTVDTWLRRARLTPLPGHEWSLDAAGKPVDATAELVERLLRREIADELKTESVDEQSVGLARIGKSERDAAELHLRSRHLRTLDKATQAKLQPALNAALARIELPPQFRAAQEAFAELDLAAAVLTSNWESLRSGDESHAHNFETSKFLIVEDGKKLVSLSPASPNERLSDEARNRFTAFRKAEADADAAMAPKIAGTVIAAAARAGIDAVATVD